MKDYVDLYFILQRFTLNDLLSLCAEKLPRPERALIPKAIVFFDDLDEEPPLYMKGRSIPFKEGNECLRARAARAY